MCLSRRTALGSRQPSLNPGLPLEWGRAERAGQGGAGRSARPSPRHHSPCARGLMTWSSGPHQGRKRGSCSTTATVVSPSSVIVRRLGCVFVGIACGPFCSPCGLGGCVDPPHTCPLTEGHIRERGRRARRSPNARLQSFLGSAVRSAKCLRHRKRPGPSREGLGETRAWRIFSLKRAS